MIVNPMIAFGVGGLKLSAARLVGEEFDPVKCARRI